MDLVPLSGPIGMRKELALPISLALPMHPIHSMHPINESYEIKPLWLQKLEKIDAMSNINRCQCTSTPKNIVTILNQFGEHDYDKYSNIMISGYIRNLQKQISSIIPSDITNVCFSFYFEKENEYINFAYKLYQIMGSQANDFSGKTLVLSIMDNSGLSDQFDKIFTENTSQICNNLLEYNFIELSSYKIKLSLLFSENDRSDSLFNASENHKYRFSSVCLSAFKQFHPI